MTARATVATTTSSSSTTSTSSTGVVVDLPADAQLVALGVGEDDERPQVARAHRIAEQQAPEADQPLHEELRRTRVEVDVDPVLGTLPLGHALQEDDRPVAVGGQQVQVRVPVALGVVVAESRLPERRQHERVQAVDADLHARPGHTRSLRCCHLSGSPAAKASWRRTIVASAWAVTPSA